MEAIGPSLDDWTGPRVTHLATAQFSQYPESKEMRGMFKLESRLPLLHPKKYGLQSGFKLRYEAPVQRTTWEEALAWWVKDEQRYRVAHRKESA